MPAPIPDSYFAIAAPRPAPPPPLPDAPWTEAIPAAFRTTIDEVPDVEASRLDDAHLPLVEGLRERGVERRFLRPWYGTFQLPFTDNSFLDRDAIWDEIERIRAIDPSAFSDVGTREQFELRVRRRNGDRDRDQEILSRAGIVPRLIGSIPAMFRDPVNAATAPIGGVGRTLLMRMVTEGLVNTGVEAAQTPGRIALRERMGEETSAADVALDLGGAFLGGAALRGGIEAAPRLAGDVRSGFDRTVEANWDRLPQGLRDRWASRAKLPEPEQDLLTTDLAEELVGAENLSQIESDALVVTRRDAEIEEGSPFLPSGGAARWHPQLLGTAMERVLATMPATPAPPAASTAIARASTAREGLPRGGLHGGIVDYLTDAGLTPGQARGIAAGIHAESASNPNAVNPTSGAYGIGQWLGPRKRELFRRYGNNPTLSEQLEFLTWELRGGDHGGARVLAQGDEAQVLRSYIVDFMRPAKGAETTGDLERGMAALGRGADPLPLDGGGPRVRADVGEEAYRARLQDEADALAARMDRLEAQRAASIGEGDIDIFARAADAPTTEFDPLAVRRFETMDGIAIESQPEPLWIAAGELDTRMADLDADTPAFAELLEQRGRLDAIASGEPDLAGALPLDEAVVRWRADETNPATGHFSAAEAEAAIEIGRRIAVAGQKDRVERVDVLEGAAYVVQARAAAQPAVPVRRMDARSRGGADDGSGAARPQQRAAEPAAGAAQAIPQSPEGSDIAPDGEARNPATAAPGNGAHLAALPEADRSAFLDPDGAAAKAMADSLEHDARAMLDTLDEGGSMPTVRIEEEGAERTLLDLIEDLDAEEADLARLRACL